MLKDILSVSGKPGLYKLLSKSKNMLIIESLTDKKRISVSVTDKIMSLGDISVYTADGETPLHAVLTSIKEKENSAPLGDSPATPNELRAYLAGLLPDFDRNRVYPTDIKKIRKWYNLLVAAGITDFQSND
jgi:hypothetical protein